MGFGSSSRLYDPLPIWPELQPWTVPSMLMVFYLRYQNLAALGFSLALKERAWVYCRCHRELTVKELIPLWATLIWELRNLSGIFHQWMNTPTSSVSSGSTFGWYDLPVLQRAPNRIMLQWLTVVTCSWTQPLLYFLSFHLSHFFTPTSWDQFPNKTLQSPYPNIYIWWTQIKTVWWRWRKNSMSKCLTIKSSITECLSLTGILGLWFQGNKIG